MIGERLRGTRQAQSLSLTDVASKVGISAATLSRIETSKQGINLELFLALAKILKAIPHELLGEANSSDRSAADPLAKKIAGLGPPERAKLWRELAAARRARRAKRRELNQHFEELLAQIEYLRQEMDSVRLTLRRR